MSNKEELLKLMQENPDLPLVFFVASDEYSNTYCWSAFEDFRAYKRTVYLYEKWSELTYSDDLDDVLEYYMDYFSEDEEYKDLDDQDYEEQIEEYIENNIEHYEAIVIYVD